MRVVRDTNVLARAHQKARGPARRVLLYAISDAAVLVVSPYILGELERVLTYPRLLKRSGLTASDIVEYLESLAAAASLVQPEPVPRDVLRDPTDLFVLGTALAGKSGILCTRDADFFDGKVQKFCEANGIRVLTDLEFIDKFKI
ncbi:MAG: putative toxin-antitoxin system toxin component, PIN family [Candidatus Acidiferrum sp.]